MSKAAIYEAIGRTKAAGAIVAGVTAHLESMGLVTLTLSQRERLVRLVTAHAAQSIALCTLLHEIADTQPTNGETHVQDAAARSPHRV